MRAIAGIAEIAGIGVNEVHTHTMRGVAGKAAAGAGVLFEKSYKKWSGSGCCAVFVRKIV